jgi:hypothetical protein
MATEYICWSVGCGVLSVFSACAELTGFASVQEQGE